MVHVHLLGRSHEACEGVGAVGVGTVSEVRTCQRVIGRQLHVKRRCVLNGVCVVVGPVVDEELLEHGAEDHAIGLGLSCFVEELDVELARAASVVGERTNREVDVVGVSGEFNLERVLPQVGVVRAGARKHADATVGGSAVPARDWSVVEVVDNLLPVVGGQTETFEVGHDFGSLCDFRESKLTEVAVKWLSSRSVEVHDTEGDSI